MVPETVTEVRVVKSIQYKQEQRQRTYTVVKCVPVTKQVVQGLHVSTSRARVGLVSYSDNAQVNFYLDSYSNNEEVIEFTLCTLMYFNVHICLAKIV